MKSEIKEKKYEGGEFECTYKKGMYKKIIVIKKSDK